ncbi:hypothetical protein C8F04DRAFT_1043653, partial [Mycena alexandri]
MNHFLRNSTVVDNTCHVTNNCRKLSDILAGCLTTISAAIWVSVHPNVPAPGQSRVKLVFRRLGLMLVAVIAPELIVFFAIRQFYAARDFVCEFPEDIEITLTHGFFFSMGGFVSRAKGHPITTIAQLNQPEVGDRYKEDIRNTTYDAIMDRSKSDALAKGYALSQGVWFILQISTRFAKRLPTSELEIATLAYAVVNVFTWVIWWHKPYDVHQAILVGPDEEPDVDRSPRSSLTDGNIAGASGRDSEATEVNPSTNGFDDSVGVWGSAIGGEADQGSTTKTTQSNIEGGNPVVKDTVQHGPSPRTSTTNYVNLSTSNPPAPQGGLNFSTRLEISVLRGAIQGTYKDYEPLGTPAVPALWSSPKSPPKAQLAAMLVAIVFGMIHCIAWNASFPSAPEHMLWRVCAAWTAGYPTVILVQHLVLSRFHGGGHVHDHIPLPYQMGGVGIYFVVRLVLIVLAFTTMRTLESGWFTDISWTKLVLHFI